MTVSVSNVDSFVNDSDTNAAVTEGLANYSGIPPAYVDVDVAALKGNRRLRSQPAARPELVTLTYAIAVGGLAPESVATTGPEVGAKLESENSEAVEDAIFSSLEESLGWDYAFSVKEMNEPTVIVQDPSAKDEHLMSHASGLPSYSSRALCIVIGLLMLQVASGIA